MCCGWTGCVAASRALRPWNGGTSTDLQVLSDLVVPRLGHYTWVMNMFRFTIVMVVALAASCTSGPGAPVPGQTQDTGSLREISARVLVFLPYPVTDAGRLRVERLEVPSAFGWYSTSGWEKQGNGLVVQKSAAVNIRGLRKTAVISMDNGEFQVWEAMLVTSTLPRGKRVVLTLPLAELGTQTSPLEVLARLLAGQSSQTRAAFAVTSLVLYSTEVRVEFVVQD